MQHRLRFARMTSGPAEWSTRKVQVALGVAALIVLSMIAGLILLVSHEPLGGATPEERQPSAIGTGEPKTQADRIANSSLPSAAAELARPGELSTMSVGSLLVPAAQELGAAQVPTGFPQTLEGAVAQLAAIDQTALSSASVPRAQEVIRSWVAPGGPTAETWSGVRATAALLSSAGLAADSSTQLELEVEPAMVLIKGQIVGSAGPNESPGDTAGTPGIAFVVPCLQMVVTARLGSATHRTAVADCQRMVWVGDRWVIGPGEEPAPAPSLWPGSADSYAAGYRWLEASP